MGIKLKAVGQNLILSVEDEVYTKRFENAELRNEVKELAKEVELKPNKTKIIKLVKYFTSVQEQLKREEEQSKTIKKSVEKKIAKEVKKLDTKKKGVIAGIVETVKKVVKKEPNLEERLAALEKENAELKAKLENKPAPTTSSTRRSGEY